jgi:hypothetical protein
MDYGSNPWPRLRRNAQLPPAASNCHLTNALARLRGQRAASCEPLLEVLLGSWGWEHPRSLAANQKLVGPGTPRPAQPLPLDVAAFVEGARAQAGLVLAAFGSTPHTALLLSRIDLEELAAGFAALAPTRVLWALQDKGLPPGVALSELPLGPNTKVVPWVDYNVSLSGAGC